MKKIVAKILLKLNLFYFFDFFRRLRFFNYRKHIPYVKIIFNEQTVEKANIKEISNVIHKRNIDSIAIALETEKISSQWRDIYEHHQNDAVQMIKDKEYDALKSLLSKPLSSDLMYGFDNLAKSLNSRFRLETRNESEIAADHFLALSEFCGNTNYFNPEEILSPFKKEVFIDTIIKKLIIENFSDDFIFPNPFIGERGIQTPWGSASLRVPAAIYQALRIIKFGKNICEIGPGLGRTAFFANKLGANKYTLVDIPISSLCQGYFLGRALPSENFSFSNESEIESGIKFCQPNDFLNNNEKYDVIFNSDSITEIGENVANSYLKSFIGKTNLFMSINHEGNEFRVRDLAAKIPEYHLISINRSWLRAGYVEELYEIR